MAVVIQLGSEVKASWVLITAMMNDDSAQLVAIFLFLFCAHCVHIKWSNTFFLFQFMDTTMQKKYTKWS